jgi:hypothetical protein
MRNSTISRQSVIQSYLAGKTFEEISLENHISKGNAFNIVKDWRHRIKAPDVDTLRDFSIVLKKSGMTVEKCAQGLRCIQILSKFGISDDPDINYDSELNTDAEKSYSSSDKLDKGVHADTSSNFGNLKSIDNFSSFITELYNNCTRHHVNPSSIINWVRDLIEFNSSHLENNTGDGDTNLHISRDSQNSNITEHTDPQLPFISKIDGYIAQKKLEAQKLKKDKSMLVDNINKLISQKNTVTQNLNNIVAKEKRIISYYRWFSNLKQELLQRTGIIIEEEIESFAKVIVDLKEHHFDIHQIIQEYKEIESLRQERHLLQTAINLHIPLRNDLLTEISNLNEQISYSKLTMYNYNELFNMGLGLKELKQLVNTVMEIAPANKIVYSDVVPKFLKDIEEQYDDKLGFENTINNLKSEKEKLQNEVPEYRWYLQLQGIVGPTIIHLNSCGVSNEDIININNLVLSFKNSNFIDTPYSKEQDNSINNNSSLSNNEYWKLFINKLESLKNIQDEFDEKLSKLDYLKLQIEKLDKKKQDMEQVHLSAVFNLNRVISQTSHTIEAARQINEGINRKIMTPYPRSNPILVNLMIVNNKDEKDDDYDKNK